MNTTTTRRVGASLLLALSLTLAGAALLPSAADATSAHTTHVSSAMPRLFGPAPRFQVQPEYGIGYDR